MNAMSNDIAAIEHPSWCSRSDCQVAEPEGGAHLSRPAPARSARTDLAVTIQLVQYQPVDGFPDSGQPFVSLVAQLPDYGPDHPAEEYLLCFDSEQAQAAGRILLNTGRDASPRPVPART